MLRALPAVMSLLLSRARLLSRPAQTGARALVARAPFSTLAQGAETEEQEFSPDAAVAFEAAEPTFMTTLTFSEDGIKAMIDKDIDREKVRVTSVAAARRRTRNARGALTFHPPSSRRPLRFVSSPNRLRERTANRSRRVRVRQSAAKLIGLLGGRLETYHVTTTGSSNAVLVYRFPKNHDVQTLVYALMASGSYAAQTTTKLMRWSDAAMSLRAARNLYNRGGVSCKIN